MGIGANTAIFSIVDAVLFRPLPANQPDQLVRFFASNERGKDLSNTSYPVYADYRDQAQAFSGIAAYSDWVALHISVDAQKAERVTGAVVTGNYFDLLGIKSFHRPFAEHGRRSNRRRSSRSSDQQSIMEDTRVDPVIALRYE